MNSLENLEKQTQEAIDSFQRYDEDLPVRRQQVSDILEEGETASEDQVHSFLDQNIDFYDEILDKDSEELREQFHRNTRYNPSNSQIIRDIASPSNAALTAVAGPPMFKIAEASGFPELALPATVGTLAVLNFKASELSSDQVYMRGDKTIGIGKDQKKEPEAFKNVASELFHAYQDEYSSPTWTDSFMREGMERAISTRALQQTEFDKQAETYQTHILLNGYAKAADIAGVEHNLELDDEVEDQLTESADSAETLEYNLPAALIYAAEPEEGEQVYSKLFDGNYSSLEPDLEEIRDEERWDMKVKTGFWKSMDYLPF